jgi:hypothetical protein
VEGNRQKYGGESSGSVGEQLVTPIVLRELPGNGGCDDIEGALALLVRQRSNVMAADD